MDNFKAALRSLLSTPGPTAVVIATLAIAIGANTAIFGVVNGVLLRPLGYGDENGLLVLWAANESDRNEVFRLSPADYRDVREEVHAFGGQVALYRSIGSTLTGLERPVRVGSLSVTTRMFQVLQTRPAIGQFFVDEDEKPGGAKKAVITHASWTRRFGADPAVVGATIEIDGEPTTVVAVTEPGFQFPPGNEEVELYFPMRLSDSVLLDRNHRMFDAIARLSDGVSLDTARAELSLQAERLAREFPDTNAGWGLTPRAMREELLGDNATTLSVLFASVFLVLLIACANIANVLIARSTATSREFAVRAALGASRNALCARSLAESLLLGLLGGSTGLLLAWWGSGLLRAVMPKALIRGATLSPDGTVLLFAVILSIGATVLFGAVPALASMRSDVLELVRSSGPSGSSGGALGGGRRVRELMVVAEIAIAIVLLVGAGLMVRSFARLSEVDPGFRREGVVSVAVQLPPGRHGRDEWKGVFERILERVRSVPGVDKVGAVSDLPMSDVGLGFEMEFTVPGLDALSPTARPNAELRLAFPGYFESMGIGLARGRDFDSLDATRDRTVAIVNETLAKRYFPDVNPLGRSVRMMMLGEVEIVGVVSDYRHGGLQSKYESEIFIPFGRPATREMHVVVQSDLDTSEVAHAVGDVLTEIDPQLVPSRIDNISDLLWESVAQPRFNTALLVGLALCAAILAVVGTYGIVAFTVSQRKAEIGVRMAMGADSAATVAMVVRQALAIVATGAVLGVLGALGATRFLERLLFDVPPTDPLTYAIVLVGTVVVGLLAAWTPARRATRIDPVAALRDA